MSGPTDYRHACRVLSLLHGWQPAAAPALQLHTITAMSQRPKTSTTPTLYNAALARLASSHAKVLAQQQLPSRIPACAAPAVFTRQLLFSLPSCQSRHHNGVAGRLLLLLRHRPAPSPPSHPAAHQAAPAGKITTCITK